MEKIKSRKIKSTSRISKKSIKSPFSKYLIVGILLVIAIAGLSYKGILKFFGAKQDINVITGSEIACSASFSIPYPSPTPLPSPSPVSSPIACSNCQYQADLFFGPLVTSFKGGVRYGIDINRLITSTHNNGNFAACVNVPTSPLPAPADPVYAPACDKPVINKYLTGQFDHIKENTSAGGYIIAYVQNNTTNCTYDIGAATYKMNDIPTEYQNIEAQNLFDYSLRTIKPGEKITMYIKVPMLNDSSACHNVPAL